MMMYLATFSQFRQCRQKQKKTSMKKGWYFN